MIKLLAVSIHWNSPRWLKHCRTMTVGNCCSPLPVARFIGPRVISRHIRAALTPWLALKLKTRWVNRAAMKEKRFHGMTSSWRPWWRHAMETLFALLTLREGPEGSADKGPLMQDLVFSLVLAWTHGWISRWVAGDLRRHWGSLWRHCNDASFKLFCLILRVLDLVYEALRCICTLYHFSKRTGTGSWKHYNDAIISAMTSQITSVSIVYSTVCSGIDQINIKAPCHWPLWGEFIGDRWIPHTKVQ